MKTNQFRAMMLVLLMAVISLGRMNAQVRSKRRMALRRIRSSYGHHRWLPLHGYFAVDEHAGGYYPGGL